MGHKQARPVHVIQEVRDNNSNFRINDARTKQTVGVRHSLAGAMDYCGEKGLTVVLEKIRL